MLQQTRVETALPYYRRFIERFPRVRDLALATEEQVLTCWSGLGYYSRPRRMMAAARIILEQHSGLIPCDYDALIALPGVGRYMAGAILSIAFNKPCPAVDGNVRRVLCRISGWSEAAPKELWREAEAALSAGEPRMVNQALMELGAIICSPKAPRCLLCPAQRYCRAFRQDIQDRIPPPRKRRATVWVHWFAVIDRRRDRFLVRSNHGLWEFPVFSELPPGKFSRVGSCRHVITHHRIDVSVYSGRLPEAAGYERRCLDLSPLSSLTRKILSSYQSSRMGRDRRWASTGSKTSFP